jgi:hypothetical protein
MKIPDSIRINGIEHRVVWENGLNDGAHVCHGHADFNYCTIRLNPETQTYEKQCVTLLHEILHVLLYNGRIEMPDDDEEDVVEVLSNGLYQVLQDNGQRLFDLAKREEKKEVSPNDEA